MARYNDEGWWEWEATGVDECGDEVGDYLVTGSIPASFYEVMLFAAEGVSGAIDPAMEWLR